MVTRAPDKKNLQNVSSPKLQIQIQNNFIELFLMIPSTKYFANGSAPHNKRAARATDKKYLLTTSPKPLVQIQNYFTELFLVMPSTKIAQMVPLRWT